MWPVQCHAAAVAKVCVRTSVFPLSLGATKDSRQGCFCITLIHFLSSLHQLRVPSLMCGCIGVNHITTEMFTLSSAALFLLYQLCQVSSSLC